MKLSFVYLNTVMQILIFITSIQAKAFTGPKTWDSVYHVLPMLRNDPRKALEDIWEKYKSDNGSPIQIKIPGLYNIYFVYHPDDISSLRKLENQNILIKGFTINYIKKYLLKEALAAQESNDRHKMLHRLFVPSFMKKTTSSYTQTISKIADDFFAQLAQNTKNQQIDLQEQTKAFAMTVICKTTLNYNLSFAAGVKYNKSVNTIVEYVNYKQLHNPIAALDWLPSEFNNHYQEAIDSIRQLCQNIISSDMMLEETNKLQGADSLIRRLRHNIKDQSLLVDQVVNLFFGGHETTSHWMATAIYHLESSPQHKQELRAELTKAASSSNTRQDMSADKYPVLDAFVKEVLRLNSPIEMYGRDTIADIYLRGQKIPKGSLVISSQYAAHRYSGSWTDPDSFRPERFNPAYKSDFLKEAKQSIRAFFPFGFGKRSCMGRFLAELEVKVFLASYIKQNKLRLSLLDDKRPQKEIVCTSRLKDGFKMQVDAVY